MIIQFSHPGAEMNLSKQSPKNGKAYIFNDDSKTGRRFWNTEDNHKRKFMKHHGQYIGYIEDQPKYHNSLYFWGEWEPPSKFALTENKFSNSTKQPHAVHAPFFSMEGISQNKAKGKATGFNSKQQGCGKIKGICHNTDPFVFGDHFYYTNCKQKESGKGKKMLDLPSQSIILFGSEYQDGFVLDTVFVVDSSETVKEYYKHNGEYPEILRKATIDLNGGLQKWHKLYKGRMYDCENPDSELNKQPFSFVPCKINCENSGFQRPVINHKKFHLQKLGAKSVLHSIEGHHSEGEFWNELVNDLKKEGVLLGVRLSMPKIEDV